MPRTITTLLFLQVVCLTVTARPTYRANIPNGLNVPCPQGQEEACVSGVCEGVGHNTCRGGGQRNAFGQDFALAGFEWTLELCKKDSDGDGVANGVELGDPCCLFNQQVAEFFPQAKYGVSHPGFESSIPSGAPEIDFGYCQSIANVIEDGRLSRFTETFQEGEVQLQLDFKMKNYTIPSSRITTYAFPRFSFPSDKEYDVVAIQPLLDPKSAAFVHHFVLVGCDSEWDGESGEIVEEGESVGTVYVTQNCFEIVWAWAPGVGSLIAPPNAGYHVGLGTSRRSFMLELHYDNSQQVENVLDNSGVRLFFTEGRRPQQFGVLLVGPGLNIPAFPSGEKSYYVSSMIPVAEIDEEIAPEGVTAFASFVHGHQFARKIFSSILRRNENKQTDVAEAGRSSSLFQKEAVSYQQEQSIFMQDSAKFLGFDQELAEVTKDIDIMPTFSFANQRTIPISNTQIKNGDYLGVGCVYDSSEATDPVIGGWGTVDEMCIDLVYVYPVEAINVQGFTTSMVTPYDWIGRVVTGTANTDAVSLPTMGVMPWVDFQSELTRVGCPMSIGNKLDSLNQTVGILESVCGFEGLSTFVAEAADPFFVYYPVISSFNALQNCSQQCGAFLSASIGCLVSRYGSVVNNEQGWQIAHAPFPELVTADDVFYLGYWWALYHNFPQTCDQHLNQYIIADSEQENALLSLAFS